MSSLRRQACTNMSHVAETYGNNCSPGLIPEKYGRASQVLEVLEWLHGDGNSMELFGLESKILGHAHSDELSCWNSCFSDGILSKIVKLSTNIFVSNTNQLCKRSIILASNLWLICSMNLNSLTVLLYKLYDPEDTDCMDYATLHTLLCDMSKFQLENLVTTKSTKRLSSSVKVQELLNEIYEYSIARQSAVVSLSPSTTTATGVSLESFVTFFNLRKKNQLWSVSAFQRKICESTFGVKVWSEIRVWAHPKYLDLDIASVADWTVLHNHILEEVDEYVMLQNFSLGNPYLTTTLPIFGNTVAVIGDAKNNNKIDLSPIAITRKEMQRENENEQQEKEKEVDMLSLIDIVTPTHLNDQIVHNKNHVRYDDDDNDNTFEDWDSTLPPLPPPPSFDDLEEEDVEDTVVHPPDMKAELNISFNTTCTIRSYISSEESYSSITNSISSSSSSKSKRKVWGLLIHPFHHRSKKIIDMAVDNHTTSTTTTSRLHSSAIHKFNSKKQKLKHHNQGHCHHLSSLDIEETETATNINVTYHNSQRTKKLFPLLKIRNKICRIFGFR